ncbi:MAG: NUDIX domain-containing protein [Ginsengibacter sp.]
MSCITIYFDDKPVFLCDEITAEIEEVRHHPDAVFIDEVSTSAINSLLHEIKKPEFHAGVLYNKDFAELKKKFFKHFKIIQTGGGVVTNESGDVLIIFRRGKWDLPKGKIDEGETLEECALREVAEETGVDKLKLIRRLLITYHTYRDFGKEILKESHWFLMDAKGEQDLVPQVEEDITQLLWAKRESLSNYMSNTFPTIKSVLTAAGMLK